jgi:hypothetical protein
MRLSLLEHRRRVEDLSRDDVWDGILVDLKVLAIFIAVYNRQPSPAIMEEETTM